jgi:hypothetical protein
MKYMILIYNSEDAWNAQTPADLERGMAAYRGYAQALAESGNMVEASELAPVKTAKSITVRNGSPRVVDGPYVDIKEQLGGYFIIEVASEAEAIEWAQKCPGAHHGAVEVRACL